MTDYKNDLKNSFSHQNKAEHQKKAHAIPVILITGTIALIGIIVGIYLFSNDVEETNSINRPNTTTQSKNSVD